LLYLFQTNKKPPANIDQAEAYKYVKTLLSKRKKQDY